MFSFSATFLRMRRQWPASSRAKSASSLDFKVGLKKMRVFFLPGNSNQEPPILQSSAQPFDTPNSPKPSKSLTEEANVLWMKKDTDDVAGR